MRVIAAVYCIDVNNDDDAVIEADDSIDY